MELTQSFASKLPLALRYTKCLMKQAQRQELPDFLQTCANFQAICHHTDDHHEAVDVVLAKRKPNFKGS